MAKRKLVVHKVQGRGLTADVAEVAAFPYTHQDILMAQAMIGGAKTIQEIADAAEMNVNTARHALLCPVRCAWISQEIEKAVETRLGSVMGAVYSRAIATGDPRCAEMLLKHYGRLRPDRKEQLHVHASVDLSGLSNDELKRLIDQKARQLNLKQEGGSSNAKDPEHDSGNVGTSPTPPTS